MTKDEANESIKLIGNLFNQIEWNDDLVGIWLEVFYSLEVEDAEAAMREHRIENATRTPHISAVRTKAMERKRKRLLMQQTKERVIDVIRREDLARGKQYVGKTDNFVLVLHFSRAWQAVRDSDAPDFAKQVVRREIYNHCLSAFREIRIAGAEADEAARSCVELGIDEKIISRQVLRAAD